MAKKKAKGGKKPAGKKGSSSSNMTTVAVIIVAVILGAAGGVLAWYITSDSAGAVELPDFVQEPGVPQEVRDAYQAALDIPEELEQVPCYCGCGIEELGGHENNLDCFIKSRDGDDVVWDDHGLG